MIPQDASHHQESVRYLGTGKASENLKGRCMQVRNVSSHQTDSATGSTNMHTNMKKEAMELESLSLPWCCNTSPPDRLLTTGPTQYSRNTAMAEPPTHSPTAIHPTVTWQNAAGSITA